MKSLEKIKVGQIWINPENGKDYEVMKIEGDEAIIRCGWVRFRMDIKDFKDWKKVTVAEQRRRDNQAIINSWNLRKGS